MKKEDKKNKTQCFECKKWIDDSVYLEHLKEKHGIIGQA